MSRFSKTNHIKNSISGIQVSVLIFIVLLFLFLRMISGISSDTLEREEASLKTALNRAIVSCYCIEGTYPPSLDYIKAHYGLIYDDETFFVDYTPIGSNIYPDVTILRREGKDVQG
jgi:hypothetical protein